jgi:hypothetical protein
MNAITRILSPSTRETGLIPSTNVATPTLAELTQRVLFLATAIEALSREVARLNRVVAELPTATVRTVSTAGPVPEVDDPHASGRGLIRAIGVALGKNEDSIRKSLTTSPVFATLRTAFPDLTTNVKVMRWLATPPEGFTESRYEIAMRQVATLEEIRTWDA